MTSPMTSASTFNIASRAIFADQSTESYVSSPVQTGCEVVKVSLFVKRDCQKDQKIETSKLSFDNLKIKLSAFGNDIAFTPANLDPLFLKALMDMPKVIAANNAIIKFARIKG